jgi:hypothetical protein
MNKDELLKLALEALENGKRVRNAEGGTKYQPELEDKAITAIKQARSAPVQEPVAHDYRTKYDRGCYKCLSQFCPGNCEIIVGKPAFEAIEAKLKEKNT